MVEILVLSGKGGTGKTTLTAALANLAAGQAVITDLDVDAPDLHLLLAPHRLTITEFISGHQAVIDPALCDGCGECRERCRFSAVQEAPEGLAINPLLCEGCGVCVHFCPRGAIAFPERKNGEHYLSETRFGPLVHALLDPGQENSGRLVALLRQRARELARERGLGLIISDGAPGIGCPVISSLSGVSLALAVTEPTPSGLHDLARVAELAAHFRVPVGVVVNKADLWPAGADRLAVWCAEQGLSLLGRLPHDPGVPAAMVAGQTLIEHDPAGRLAGLVRDIWAEARRLAQKGD